MQLPSTEKQIKGFLGLTGYYINVPTYIEAFEKLKTLINNPPTLRYHDFGKQFTLTTDASNYAIGAVLSQEGHPVCFASRTLNNHERNYPATDKEFLTIL